MFCVYVCIYVVYGGEGVGVVCVTGLGSFLHFFALSASAGFNLDMRP